MLETQSRSPMPEGIDIAVVVYGDAYAKLLAEVCLPNLAALVLELPPELRSKSRVRIVTTRADAESLERAKAFALLSGRIEVVVTEGVNKGRQDRDWGYAPMVATQRLLVIEAARRGAAIIFVGPDTFYSKGSFAFLAGQLEKGYRLVVGPGLRIKQQASLPEIESMIAQSADGSFAPLPDHQVDIFFRHWHPSMDAFILESEKGVWWKAYVFHRPAERELLVRFFQGPTLLAWPRLCPDDFDGFIDHVLPELCCSSWKEIYVVEDARQCFQLDLTEDDRDAGLDLSDFPRTDLLRSFFNVDAIRTPKLLYGLRTCRIHDGKADARSVAVWEREFSNAIDPLILLALADRKWAPRVGRRIHQIYKVICILGTNTLSFVLRGIARRVLRKFKSPDPLGLTSAGAIR